MIGGETNVLISIRSCFGSQIQFIFIISQRREFINHLIPFQIPLFTGTLAPFLCCLHSEMPVRKLERRIYCFRSTKRFLRGNSTFQHKTPFQFIISSKGIHKVGGFLYQPVVFPDYLIRGIAAIHQFCQIDEMRLLPDQETAYFRRRLRAARIGHLHPSYSIKTLPAGYFTGNGLYSFVPS